MIVEEITVRRARRALSDRPVDHDIMERVVTAATLAPSCSNKQSWRYLICSSEEALDNARGALTPGNYWARKAPVLIIVATGDDLDCRLSDNRNYALFDTGMATMNLMLQATREGLYAHPMAGFDPFAIREAFGIGPETRIVTLIAVGYPGDMSHLNENHLASETSERSRKPLRSVVSWEEWSLGA